MSDQNVELTGEQIQGALQTAQALAKELTEKELAENPEAATGACCIYVSGWSECTNGRTKDACRRAANTFYHRWYNGDQCNWVECPPS